MASPPSSKTFSSKPTDPDPALYPSPPEGLTLEQVNVFVRHGERTPTWIVQHLPTLFPAVWKFCGLAKRIKAAVAGDCNVLGELDIRRVIERIDGKLEDDKCTPGELTNIGRQSTYHYGKALRALYISRLRFLPDILDSQDTIYLRSTDLPRTIESLQEVIHGLYPTEKMSNGTVPHIRLRHPQDEDLGRNPHCGRLSELLLAFQTAAKEKYDPKLAALDQAVSPHLGGSSVRLDGNPRAFHILDSIRAAMSHNVAVPSVFMDPSVMLPLEEAVVAQQFGGYKDPEVRKLAMGRFLSSLSARMQSKADRGDRDPLKIAIYACHDTSLAGLCQTLDVFDGRWPEFTASFTMELFKGKATPPSAGTGFLGLGRPAHYVRMRYQNRTLRPPFCADPKDHYPGAPEMCTLEAFNRLVAQLTPRDWAVECRTAQRRSFHL